MFSSLNTGPNNFHLLCYLHVIIFLIFQFLEFWFYLYFLFIPLYFLFFPFSSYLHNFSIPLILLIPSFYHSVIKVKIILILIINVYQKFIWLPFIILSRAFQVSSRRNLRKQCVHSHRRIHGKSCMINWPKNGNKIKFDMPHIREKK